MYEHRRAKIPLVRAVFRPFLGPYFTTTRPPAIDVHTPHSTRKPCFSQNPPLLRLLACRWRDSRSRRQSRCVTWSFWLTRLFACVFLGTRSNKPICEFRLHSTFESVFFVIATRHHYDGGRGVVIVFVVVFYYFEVKTSTVIYT